MSSSAFSCIISLYRRKRFEWIFTVLTWLRLESAVKKNQLTSNHKIWSSLTTQLLISQLSACNFQFTTITTQFNSLHNSTQLTLQLWLIIVSVMKIWSLATAVFFFQYEKYILFSAFSFFFKVSTQFVIALSFQTHNTMLTERPSGPNGTMTIRSFHVEAVQNWSRPVPQQLHIVHFNCIHSTQFTSSFPFHNHNLSLGKLKT